MAVAGPGQLNVEEYPSWGSRSVDCFEKLEQIGEGTYGQVYMAREIRTGEIVALKKIRMDNEKEGFPITAIREIKILKKLHHENVIKLKEIVTSPGPETDEQGNQDGNKFKGGIYMVFDYMDHDLTGLADRPGLRFTVPQIKCYMKQLLTGLHYCHVNQVLHRDIKGSNLLIDNEGNLKLADFGLARSFSTDHTGNLTNRVITLWYRPPELLLGATKYGPAVDMWSVGCIFAELLNGKPILPGKNEVRYVHSQVYMAREIRTGEIVALKKIRMDNEKEGFPITAIREIKILKKLHHENVIKLKEIVTSPGPETDEQGNQDGNKFKGGIYMVFDYMDHDLTGLADRPGLRFTVPQIKCYMKQLLTGLHYCHVNQVLHRDIKGSNLLIDNEGNLKLADFGLARSFSTDHTGNLTNRVITLWYRPPELLLGATKYGPAVDMWSVGCIFAELLNGKPILPGKNEPEQLNKIFELCGSPDEINWPGVSKMPWYNNFKPSRPMKRRIREGFRHFDRHALDLLDSMLTLNPDKRISAQDALVAEYFWNDPLPCDPKSLPKYESSHEFQTKKKRQQQRQNEETAKRQKLQHPQQHARLPPIQQHTGQAHPSHWHGPNHPINNAQPPVSTGPSHHQYGRPRGPPGGPNRYPPNANQSGGYNQNRGAQVGSYSGGPYPSQGRGPPYGGSGMPAPSQRGAASGYGVGPPNYSQSGQFGGSAGGRGPNPLGGNRNQQYGWQQ